jgi:hypothetical protein
MQLELSERKRASGLFVRRGAEKGRLLSGGRGQGPPVVHAREIARPTHAAENHANLTEDPREECVDRRTRGAVAVDVPAGRLARARLSRRPAVVVAAHW